jgi:hypothetical protein
MKSARKRVLVKLVQVVLGRTRYSTVLGGAALGPNININIKAGLQQLPVPSIPGVSS